MDKFDIENKGYYPYEDLAEFRDSEYFEGMFLEYFQEYRNYIDEIKIDNDDDIEMFARDVVRLRNDEEIERIFKKYRDDSGKRSRSDNEKAIVKLKKDIRLIKDIILATEPTDMERLLRIDNEMGELIDDVSLSLGITEDNRSEIARVSELLDSYARLDATSFESATGVLKAISRDICDYYRNNFSVKTATKYINNLNSKIDKLIDEKAVSLGIVYDDLKLIDELVNKYNSKKLISSSFEKILLLFKAEIDDLRVDFMEKYSSKMAKKLIKILETKTGSVIDKLANFVEYPKIHEERLQEIFDLYKPSEIDIFDMMFYSSEDEMNEFRNKYCFMSDEEKNIFEMRIYDQYVRMFKGKIRELNKDIRRVYSKEMANNMIAGINKRADDLIQVKANEIGKPVAINPWSVRKYLWADTENFMSENGLKLRQVINFVMRNAVSVAMNNELIIEERSKLDPTKQYIFVPTHYFTEDAIGMFASLDRQAYMLMGTTDQIENNPLMLAAVMFGFFHVDRMDNTNRRECIDKQNRIIDYGTNFINYVSGSWENSENELQPLSFSGPYRTSVQKNVEIVPVGLYLVREEKKIYVRYGEPMDLSNYDEKTANDIIRDTLASIHFKQMQKHSVPIETINVEGYGETHNLPYDQHTYYMEQVANEYWNQPWSKPFAVEEIGLRSKKVIDLVDVYSFVDNLSREKLIEMSDILAESLLRIDEKKRYNMIDYIDRNYDRLKNSKIKRKVKDGN